MQVKSKALLELLKKNSDLSDPESTSNSGVVQMQVTKDETVLQLNRRLQEYIDSEMIHIAGKYKVRDLCLKQTLVLPENCKVYQLV